MLRVDNVSAGYAAFQALFGVSLHVFLNTFGLTLFALAVGLQVDGGGGRRFGVLQFVLDVGHVALQFF